MLDAERFLRCDNECAHGCEQPVPLGRARVNYALQVGWVVLLWETPEFAQVHGGGHAMVFCDMLCAFEAQRQKLLKQQGPPEPQNYARRVIDLEERLPARELADAYRELGQTIGGHNHGQDEHDHDRH